MILNKINRRLSEEINEGYVDLKDKQIHPSALINKDLSKYKINVNEFEPGVSPDPSSDFEGEEAHAWVVLTAKLNSSNDIEKFINEDGIYNFVQSEYDKLVSNTKLSRLESPISIRVDNINIVNINGATYIEISIVAKHDENGGIKVNNKVNHRNKFSYNRDKFSYLKVK